MSDADIVERVLRAPGDWEPPTLDRKSALVGDVSEEARRGFERSGFLIVERLVSSANVQSLAARFDPLFRGEFDTGLYPDEWYWREGIGREDATRHMANAWKSDTLVGSLVLSRVVGRLVSRLMGWPGARLGTDTIWWKPPGASAVALHQDDAYGSYLAPAETATCWFALDDTDVDGGTIEYVDGSNHWSDRHDIGDFHAPDDYRAMMRATARSNASTDVRIMRLVVPAGSCVIHSGRVWHGSDQNRDPERPRRSVAAHLLRSDCRFREGRGGYTYGRYKRLGETEMDENFFPILWTRDGRRSAVINAYYPDMLASSE